MPKPRTDPLRKKTWDPIAEIIEAHLAEELHETAYDRDVPMSPATSVAFEKVAARLTQKFLRAAQASLKKMLGEAATLAAKGVRKPKKRR